MRFLSNGDFGFPFTWPFFWVKQVYLWSYQSGAANLDGIVRMPGRLLDVVVFALFGNLAFEYFFIFSSLVIAFVAFYYFAGKFLEAQNRPVRLLASLFFTLNPIFLGNISKIGLVLAAAMLPLCLVAVQQAFEKKRLRYLVLWMLWLNISLIHPFTFSVNAFVSGLYFVWQVTIYKQFVKENLLRFVGMAGLFLLLNAYFLLPLAGMHTISKNALSDSVASAPTNYTALVDVLNTGDIFTGLSLSKNVVKDYDFFNSKYANFYFIGAFGFYALLLGLYVRVEKRLSDVDKIRFALLLVSFLVLVMLATVTFLHADTLIRLLIRSPGGWAFRSPLKWQLYIPLTLAGLWVVLMRYVRSRRRRVGLYAGLAITFLLMNGFLAADIYKKLLVPRSIHDFAALQQLNLDHKNLLFVTGDQCVSFAQTNPAVMSELNQILASKNVQVKQVSSGNVAGINLSSYAYILDCEGTVKQLAQTYHFRQTASFADHNFQLYANRASQPYIYAVNRVFALSSTTQLNGKYTFTNSNLQQPFVTVAAAHATTPSTGLQDLFEQLSFGNISGGTIQADLGAVHAGPQTLYLRSGGGPLYYQLTNDHLSLSAAAQPGLQRTAKDNTQLHLSLSASQHLHVSYIDPTYHYQNLVANPSFEQGLWQQKVGDCYDYDDQPQIGMKLDQKDKTYGRQSLELTAGNHIACTGPPNIKAMPGQQYLLSFTYQGPDNVAGYSVGFGQDDTDVGGRLPATNGNAWHTFTTVVTVPNDAHTLQLLLEAYPNDTTGTTGVAHFDNVRLAAIPALQGRFYLLSSGTTALQIPANTSFIPINPTKTAVTIRGASTPFYLATSETYASGWRLERGGRLSQAKLPTTTKVAVVPAAQHVELNNSMNGWYVDPAQLCTNRSISCARNADGTYDLTLVMEFAPQRWLYAGMLVSTLTFLGVTSWVGYTLRRAHAEKGRWRWYRPR